MTVDDALEEVNVWCDAASASTHSRCASSALGHAVAAHHAALTHASERKQFGRRLVELQLVQARLVTCRTPPRHEEGAGADPQDRVRDA